MVELIKAVAIIGMVFVHIYELTAFAYCETNTVELIAGRTISIFGGIISGGAFMFAMGWGGAFSDRSTTATYLKRSLKLFLLGLLVNLFTQYMRMLIFPENFGTLGNNLFRIIAVDIYAFAALAMLYLALMKSIKDNNRLRFIISAVLFAIAMVIDTFFRPKLFSTGNIGRMQYSHK